MSINTLIASQWLNLTSAFNHPHLISAVNPLGGSTLIIMIITEVWMACCYRDAVMLFESECEVTLQPYMEQKRELQHHHSYCALELNRNVWNVKFIIYVNVKFWFAFLKIFLSFLYPQPWSFIEAGIWMNCRKNKKWLGSCSLKRFS